MAIQNTSHSRSYTFLFFIFFSFFCALVLREIKFAPFFYDSAIHIEVSDVLAHDIGTSITPYKNELFIAQTTGPTLTIPGAIITRLLGPSITTAAISAALVNLFCFLWLFFSLRTLLGVRTSCLAASALITVFILQDLQWWVWMIGDNAAFLLFLVAATIACNESTNTRKKFIWLGITTALSLQARLTSIPLLVGCWIFLLTNEIFDKTKKESWQQLVAHILSGISALALCLLPYNILEYSFYHNSTSISYADFLKDRLSFLSQNSAVGIGNLLEQDHIFSHIYQNILNSNALLGRQLHEKYGIPEKLAWLLPIATILFSTNCLLRGKHNLNRLISCLLTAYLLLLIWFFMLATLIYSRYTFQIIELSLVIICLSILRSNSIFLIGFFTLSLCASAQLYRQPSLLEELHISTEESPKTLLDKKYNQSILEAAAFIEEKPPRFPLAKYGWVATSRALNYLLPGTDNFQDAVMLIHSALSKKPDGAYEWNKDLNFTLVIENASWKFVKTNPKNRAVQNILMAACKPGLIFENLAYRIMECTFSNIKHAVPIDSDNAFTQGKPY